ncbi:MAG: M48 family metalloprotease [Victivallaceae bacterium]|nr:M48 family metalloprotease [Victivallaceae bacterium]
MSDGETALFSYEEVRKNFIKSFFLVAILLAVAFGLSYWIGMALNDPKMGILIGVVVCAVVIPIQILTAKWVILGMARGRRASPDDLRERRAIQIVEGLAVSAGLRKTPDLYIIPSDVPNAFASGLSENSAFVAVTEGLLGMMDDQELEGVIGHEIGHVLHRDIMLNQLVVGLISVILILAIILERVLWIRSLSGDRRSSNRENGGNLALLMLVLMLAAILVRPIAMLIGQLLQLAISRQREYAADACSVRLCSYSEGLARALEKLGGEKQYSKKEVASLGGGELACMYINFPGEGLFSTHPPIAERVRRLRSMY